MCKILPRRFANDGDVTMSPGRSVFNRHPPLKLLPDPIPLKIQFPFSNAQDREPTHSQAQTGYTGSIGSSLWVGRAYSLTCGREF